MADPIRILIVDDEAPARNRLREVLADCAENLPVIAAGEAASGREALDWLEHNTVDVVLLDIRMPEMDGIELARHMQKLKNPPAVVFCTAYDQHAIEAFEVNAIDYLLKPVRRERLILALNKAQAYSRLQLKAVSRQPRVNLAMSVGGKIMLVPVADIVFLRAEQKYVTVRTLMHEYLTEESLMHLEQEFGEHFVRIHRNCIVARDFIAGFERQLPSSEDEAGSFAWTVLLRGLEEKLPISRRHRHIVKETAGD
ncbi:MAG: LytTR family DNA-binding domain-containing protein [Sulfuricella sp.]